MADQFGRDVEEAFVYVTGCAAYAPVDGANVLTKAKLASNDLGSSTNPMPTGFKWLGLRKSDGGPEESREAGDAIEFLEKGFKLIGDGSVSVAMTLAQYNAIVREFMHGTAPDVNGVVEVDFAYSSKPFILFLEAVGKGGQIERQLGVAMITEGQRDKDEQGAVKGMNVTCEWQASPLFNNKAYFEAKFDTTAVVPDETP